MTKEWGRGGALWPNPQGQIDQRARTMHFYATPTEQGLVWIQFADSDEVLFEFVFTPEQAEHISQKLLEIATMARRVT